MGGPRVVGARELGFRIANHRVPPDGRIHNRGAVNTGVVRVRGLRMYSPRPRRLPPTTRCAGERPRLHILSDRWLPRPRATVPMVPAARPMTGTADDPPTAIAASVD